MKFVSGKAALVKLAIIALLAVLLGSVSLLGNKEVAKASAVGPSASHTDAPGEDNCTSCHTSFPVNSGMGSVVISGVPQNYGPGQQIPITVTVSQAEDAVIYGFQLTAIDASGKGAGTFTLPEQNPATIQLIPGIVGGNDRQYVEHTSDGLFTDGVFGSNSWTFNWTAPAQSAGRVDFYVAGNAADSNSNTTNDYIYTATTASLPSAGPSVSVSGTVFTAAGLALRNARVTLTDSNNMQTTAFTSPFGIYNFDDVQPGTTYTLGVQSKRFRFASRVLSVNDNLTNIDFTGLE